MQTNRARMLKLTTGALALAISLTACQSRQPSARMKPAIGAAAVEAQPAVVLVSQADAARVAGNPAAAVSFAELAVTADSQSVEARTALAKAYFAAGRYQSATDAYSDLVAINPADDHARFRAALAALAGGKRGMALSTLEGLAAKPALVADVGLAFALSGEAGHAVDLLTKAVRGGDVSPRVRQNLALAQALAGEWAAARVTASIDLSPDVVDRRVAEWAAIASKNDSAVRTAAMLGVDAVPGDNGRPVQLAWSPPQANTEVAVAEQPAEAPVAVVGQVAFAELAPVAAEPVVRAEPVQIAPVQIVRVELPVAPAPKPVVFEGKAASKPALVRIKAVPPSGLSLKPVVAVKREIRALPKPSQGVWVVQLGSYAKPALLNVGWQGLVQKNKALGDYKPIKSSIDVKGATYHRLAVGTFASVAEAGRLCSSLKAEGHRCFIRKDGGTVAAPKVQPKRA